MKAEFVLPKQIAQVDGGIAGSIWLSDVRDAAASELVCAGFTSIMLDIITFTPADVDAREVGHFGFLELLERE